MSLFSKILNKLGLSKPEASAETSKEVAPAAKPVAPVAKPAAPAAAATPATPAIKPVAPAAKPASNLDERRLDKEEARSAPAEPKPVAISEVDVVAKLEGMTAGSELNWKTSIVDLLKVLGMDAGKDDRIELAKELGCPAELIGGDYTKMNAWLHKEVLKQIAQNGGNIPKELLD
jgi:hypothetical protein